MHPYRRLTEGLRTWSIISSVLGRSFPSSVVRQKARRPEEAAENGHAGPRRWKPTRDERSELADLKNKIKTRAFVLRLQLHVRLTMVDARKNRTQGRPKGPSATRYGGRGRGEGERKRDKKREIVRNTKSRIFHRIYLSSGPRSALAIYLSHGVSPLRCPTPRRALVALSTYFTYSIACCRAHPHPCTLTLCTSCHARSCASSPLSGLASRLRACLAWGGLSHPTPPPRSAAPVAPRIHMDMQHPLWRPSGLC